MDIVHATCIAFAGKGVLLRGPSGSGKSDLALRAIDGGARLVADDRVILSRRGDKLIASAPPTLYGMIEIRGLGVMRMDADKEAEVALVADLECAPIERLPERKHCELLGVTSPWIKLAPFEASAAIKLRLALEVALDRARLL